MTTPPKITPPKRDVRAALATGGLLLIPLAALWLLLNPAHGPGAGGRPAPTPEEIRQGIRQGKTGGPGSEDAPADPGTPADPNTPAFPGPARVPPPRLAAGAPVQADFTLLGVSYIPRNGSATPPPALAPPRSGLEPPSTARNPFVQAGAGAVGLWIGVRGGLGVKTLTVPLDGRRHSYPFGRFSLVAESRLSGGRAVYNSTQWEGPGGMPLYDMDGQPPYTLSYSGVPSAPGRPVMQALTLTPASFSTRFRVTALPLSASGGPVGRAVTLRCQRVTATALFVQLPAGYGPAIRQFRVTVARAGGKTDGKKTDGKAASWLIADLPPSVQAAQDGTAPTPATASARFGPFALRAVAAEAEDTSGDAGPMDQHPNRPGEPYSQNMDQHPWTGLPIVRYLLLARAAAPPPPGQTWLFQLDRVTPQWSAPPPPPSSFRYVGVAPPLGLFPLPGPASRTDLKDRVLQDGEVGAAWPGQQRRVTLQGLAIRQATRTETVTFHDAEVVWDAGFGGDRIVWHHPETETTASGIAVTVVNGRPGRRDTTAAPPPGQSFGQDWWYDRGNAELLLAWRLPPGLPSGQGAALNAPRVAEPPQGRVAVPPGGRAGALNASWDTARPAPYIGAVTLPGTTTDARPLGRDGYAPLRLSVWAAQSPTRTLPPMTFSPPMYPPGRPAAQEQPPLPGQTFVPRPPFMPGRSFVPGQPFVPRRMLPPAPLPRYSWREGPFVVKASPLPRHLASITLQITIREEQERRPIRLVVPVSSAFPPGTDPRARPAVPFPLRRAPLVLSTPPPTTPRAGEGDGRMGRPSLANL